MASGTREVQQDSTASNLPLPITPAASYPPPPTSRRSFSARGSSFRSQALPFYLQQSLLHGQSHRDFRNGIPNTFICFPLLPKEIRLAIWNLILPGPRLVPLQYIPYTPSSTNPKQGCTSNAPIPVTLHVNKESRALTMESYALSFQLMKYEPKIWFAREKDVLGFRMLPGEGRGVLEHFRHFSDAVYLVEGRELDGVKRLLVEEEIFGREVGGGLGDRRRGNGLIGQFWDAVRRKFGSVIEVVVLINGGEVGDGVAEVLGDIKTEERLYGYIVPVEVDDDMDMEGGA